MQTSPSARHPIAKAPPSRQTPNTGAEDESREAGKRAGWEKGDRAEGKKERACASLTYVHAGIDAREAEKTDVWGGDVYTYRPPHLLLLPVGGAAYKSTTR